MSLKLRRGTNSQRLTITPELGELLYTTDTKQLYAGDGTTPGGTLVSYNGSLEGELGGNLILNGQNITGAGNIDITGTISSTGNITTQGNVVVQGNITLGSTDQTVPNNDSLVINAEINSDLTPRTADSFDVGSQTKRWRTVYANNVFADLEGNVRAQDSTVLVDSVAGVLRGTLEGLVSNPGDTAVQGDVIGNVSGNLIGSVVSGDGEVLVVENGTDGTDAVFRGTFIGDLQGTVENGVLTTNFYSDPSWIGTLNGNKIFGIVGTPENPVLVDGDVQGSVLAQDSTLLVDGVIGVLRGTHIGDLQGSVYTGSISIIENNIVSDTNEDIVISTQGDGIVSVTAPLKVTSIEISNDPAVSNLTISHSANTSQPFITYGAYDSASSSSGNGAAAVFSRSRGTTLAPTALQNDDEIATVVFAGNTNSPIPDFRDAANIMVKAVSVSAGAFIEGRLEIRTTNSSGVTATKLAVNGDGSLEMTDSLLVAGVGAGQVDTAAPAKFVKVFIGSTAYAMPLYAIN
jgi:hypothetical protein